TARRIATSVVAAAGVTVEETVLPLRIYVVSRDARREGRLVIVERPRALRIGAVDQSIAVVVFAVGTLRLTDRDLAEASCSARRARIAVCIAARRAAVRARAAATRAGAREITARVRTTRPARADVIVVRASTTARATTTEHDQSEQLPRE